MRTLVDLLNDEKGYVRIFADQGGFGYEKSAHTASAYVSGISGDLFDRMSGYQSMANAREAALLQLQALQKTQRRRRTKKAS
jgi:hypothetical protein